MLTINSKEVLKRRYLLKDNERRVIESPDEMFRRVARHVASGEKNFKKRIDPIEVEERFYGMMHSLEFMPNSPTLMNAGTPLGQLSACFVLPVEDSIKGIFRSLNNMASIHQSGGGTGFSFSSLRPKDDLVYSTKGAASGPVSFMKIFDTATGVIVQGGRRRGANMGVLRCDHPDIVEFVESKVKPGEFNNFNLSVGVTDRFMEAVKHGRNHSLINPRTGKRSGDIKARDLFSRIVASAWLSGDPGLIFLDEVNRKNPTPLLGRIEATNPCGELPLLPFESCNLASINLARMVSGSVPDWERIRRNIIWGVRFLDDVIEVNKFPLKEIKEITFANRKIGLGVMGFADMLISLGIPYDSPRAALFAEDLMKFIKRESLKASSELAKERGVFKNFSKSVYAKKGVRLRNATVNTIAPTGTISVIAGCSSGIEPLFAISFIRNVLSGRGLFEMNRSFEDAVKERGFYNKRLIEMISQKGSVRSVKNLSDDIKRVFVTAFDIKPKDHLSIQAAFQRHCDNSVSKTINMPSGAKTGDVANVYMEAYRLRLKGITIYRYGSKKDQVLSFVDGPGRGHRTPGGMINAGSEYSGGCVSGTCPF